MFTCPPSPQHPNLTSQTLVHLVELTSLAPAGYFLLQLGKSAEQGVVSEWRSFSFCVKDRCWTFLVVSKSNAKFHAIAERKPDFCAHRNKSNVNPQNCDKELESQGRPFFSFFTQSVQVKVSKECSVLTK
jgi:hypothetical protein